MAEDIPKPVYDLFGDTPDGPDMRFMGPTQKCMCGSTMFHAIVWYTPPEPDDEPDDEASKAVAGYFTEMKCVSCGALVHGATDDPTERVSA